MVRYRGGLQIRMFRGPVCNTGYVHDSEILASTLAPYETDRMGQTHNYAENETGANKPRGSLVLRLELSDPSH